MHEYVQKSMRTTLPRSASDERGALLNHGPPVNAGSVVIADPRAAAPLIVMAPGSAVGVIVIAGTGSSWATRSTSRCSTAVAVPNEFNDSRDSSPVSAPSAILIA